MKRKISVTVVLAFSALFANAQLVVDPELKQLIADAFAFFPKLKEAQLMQKAGEQRLDIARSAYFPQVSLTAGYAYVDPISKATFPIGSNQFQTIAFQPKNNLNAGVGFNYPVIDFGRSLYFVQKANEEMQQSRLAVELNKGQLAAQVAGIYYSIIYLKQAIALEDTVLSHLSENAKTVDSRLHNGDALQLDLMTVQGTISQEENRKLDLMNMLQKQMNLLQYTTNQLPVQAASAFNFPAIATTADEAMQLLAANNEFKINESKVKAQQLDIKLNRSAFFPIISLNGLLGYRNGYQPELNKMVFGGQAGISVAAPIFMGNKTRNTIKLSQLQLKLNEQGLEGFKNTFRKDIASVFSDISTLNKQLTNMTAQTAQAKQLVTLASSRYKNGVGTYVDVLNAISNEQRVALTMINNQYQLCLSNIELARLTGTVYY
jgi:outer membrane protein TolC